MSVTEQVAKQQEELARLCADTEHPLRKAVDAFEAGDKETLTRTLTDFLNSGDAHSKALVTLLLVQFEKVVVSMGFRALVEETENYAKGLRTDDPCAYLPHHETLMVSMQVGENIYKSNKGKKAVNARHDQPGGSRDKQGKIREMWASGDYGSKENCAQMAAQTRGLGVSYDTARKALRGEPNPTVAGWQPTRRRRVT